MEEAGVIVCDTNNMAVEKSLSLIGKSISYINKDVRDKESVTEKVQVKTSENMKNLINSEPKIINVGLKSFSGDYSSNLIDLSYGLIEFNKGKINSTLENIIQYGNTSGVDVLSGIALGLIHHF